MADADKKPSTGSAASPIEETSIIRIVAGLFSDLPRKGR